MVARGFLRKLTYLSWLCGDGAEGGRTRAVVLALDLLSNGRDVVVVSSVGNGVFRTKLGEALRHHPRMSWGVFHSCDGEENAGRAWRRLVGGSVSAVSRLHRKCRCGQCRNSKGLPPTQFPKQIPVQRALAFWTALVLDLAGVVRPPNGGRAARDVRVLRG